MSMADGLPMTGRRVSLAFDQTVRTDLRLLEVDEAVLAEIVAQGVVIKGHADAEAFLVTKNKSFSLKYVETSNLQLLLSPTEVHQDVGGHADDADDKSASQELRSPGGLQTQVQQMRVARAQPGLLVGATTKAHLELCETRPQLHTLHALLAERPYRGPDEEQTEQEPLQGRMDVDGDEGGNGLYSFEQLLARVQASAEQIRNELSALHALELDGAWRLVDASYLGQLLELLILSAQAEGMKLDSLDAPTLCRVMATDGYRSELVRHCLAVYCTPRDAEATGEKEGWCLDETKVCRYFAHKVLPPPTQDSEGSTEGIMPGKGVAMQRFQAAWQAALPSGVQPQMAMLAGEVLVDGKGPDALVHAFPVASLPADPAARFSLLFKLRHQWESTDMEPLLLGLQVPGQTAGALLLKYARASQPNPDGPVFFTPR